MMPLLPLTTIVLFLLSVSVNGQKEACAKGQEYAYNLDDCNKFFFCVGPLAYNMTCSTSDVVFSLDKKRCVYRDELDALDCLLQSLNLDDIEDGLKLLSAGELEAIEKSEDKIKNEFEAKIEKSELESKNENEGEKKKLEEQPDIENEETVELQIKKDSYFGIMEKENSETLTDEEESMKEIIEQISKGNRKEMEAKEMASDTLVYVKDMVDVKSLTQDKHCSNGKTVVPHEKLCHRYYNCSQSHNDDLNRYLAQNEYECPYPKLFSTVTMQCEDFQAVDCGGRIEYLNPCNYTENKCSGPNCIPCSVNHGSCMGQPDGFNYWPGREGTGFWVECRGQRTVNQNNCASEENKMMNVFSPKLNKCVAYNDVIDEVCQFSESRLPHPYECHIFYDCEFAKEGYARVCPYPMLYSVKSGKCEDPLEVDCGKRRVAKSPCDYMPLECLDAAFASCEGMPDGKNVFKTREGTPHYVVCKNERTTEKGMCEMDERGMYKQFSPGVGECMSV